MNVYFDIETIPTQDPEHIALIADGVKPPAQMKKADTILAWEQNDKPAAIVEAVEKTSFDGAFGKICCLSWAVDDDGVTSAYGDEDFIIGRFFDSITNHYQPSKDTRPVFVGHNVNEFDLRFLFKRAIILGIKPPACIPFNQRSYDTQIFDTMTYFAGYGNKISLDKLSKVLGLEGKAGMTGADVWPEYQKGNIEKIAKYCEHDVELTRSVYKRLTFRG